MTGPKRGPGCLAPSARRHHHHTTPLKRLQLVLGGNLNDCQQFYYNQQAETALAGIVFAECTELTIDFTEVAVRHHSSNEPTLTPLFPNLLRHFPAVSVLRPAGRHLPLLCNLPAPQKLRRLRYAHLEERAQLPDNLLPIIMDLSNLENLSFTSQLMCDATYGLMTEDDEVLNSATRQTGIRWLASLMNHPPHRLRMIEIRSFNSWSISVLKLVCAQISSPCRVLIIQQVRSQAMKALANYAAGSGHSLLRSITHLAFRFWSEQTACDLLALTPSLRELVLWTYYSGN